MTKMEACRIIGKKLPLYAVGIEYDDFDEGGFSIVGICDSIEEAKKIKNEAHKAFPLVNCNKIAIRNYEVNKFYECYQE